MTAENVLYYGDNLDVLRRHVKDETVDLVYLDPPFKSDADYNVLYKEQDGSRAAAQIKAFDDTWRWDQAAVEAYRETVEAGGKVADALVAFRTLVGDSDVLAYLSMMAPRLVELHRVLKPTGSLYLHCDTAASHYLKLLLDSVFHPDNFRNEVIWRRTSAHSPRRSFGPIHQTLFLYSKTNAYWFQPITRPYMKGHVDKRYREDEEGRVKFTSGGNVLTGAGATKGESGQPWRGFDPSAKHRHWAVPGFLTELMPPEFKKLGTIAKLDALYEAGLIDISEGAVWPTPVRFLEPGAGQAVQDIWAFQPYTEGTVYGTKEGIDADVKWLGTRGPERLNYPTQKPLGLLGRIIRASCPPDGVVLDPFCGCGTAVAAANALGRGWVGIDITHVAIGLIKSRLTDMFGLEVQRTFRTVGEPTTVEDAETLRQEDKFQFQAWALGLVGARRDDSDKRGGDKGIDGKLFLHLGGGATVKLLLSVKAGKLVPNFVRDLRGVIERENAEIGVLITFEEPTAGMRAEAAEAGVYETPWGKHPRIQLRTVRELLDGKSIDFPRVTGANVTARRAERAKAAKPEALEMFRQAAIEAGAKVHPPPDDDD